MMTRNIGTVDRVLRVGFGRLLVGLALTAVIGPWGYLGIVLIATGASALCPLYTMLGLQSLRWGRRLP
jgi:hypothetical protein